MLDVVTLRCSPNGWMTCLVSPIETAPPSTLEDVLSPTGLATRKGWMPLSRAELVVVYTQVGGPYDSWRMVDVELPDLSAKKLSALPMKFRFGVAWRADDGPAVKMNWWQRGEVVQTSATKAGQAIRLRVAPDQPNRLRGDVRGAIDLD